MDDVSSHAFIRNGFAAVLFGSLVCIWGLAAQAINIAEAPSAQVPMRPGRPAMAMQPGTSALPTLRVTGMIEPGDADKLSEALRRIMGRKPAKAAVPVAIVELNSMGGSVPDGLQIGMLMRNSGAMAVVRQRDLCIFSCVLAFLEGNIHSPSPVYPAECNVEIGGIVAFHNFFLNPNGLRESTSVDPVQSRLQGFTECPRRRRLAGKIWG